MTTIRQHLEDHLRTIAPEISDEEVEGIMRHLKNLYQPHVFVAVYDARTLLPEIYTQCSSIAHAYLLSKGSELAERFK